MAQTAALLDQAETLAAAGDALGAVDLLTEATRAAPDPVIQRRLVMLRYHAWSEIDRAGPVGWGAPVPDLFPGVDRIPEVHISDLSGEVIRSAFQHHAGLVVRELLSAEWCERLKAGIDRSWEAIERYRATDEFDTEWFHPYLFDAMDMAERAWPLQSGTSYVPDSPRLLFDLLEAFDHSGIKAIVGDYFDEAPALSLVKLAQRRLPPEATGGWHQDGAVYGVTARTLNVWVPVTRCGDVAPGLEMWPRPLDYLVGTVSDSGPEAFVARPDEVAALTARVPADRPVFGPGDAALFDQFLLHQTAASEAFTDVRYGFECWFFAPSTYPQPERWIPLTY